jgi:mandelamide amidase
MTRLRPFDIAVTPTPTKKETMTTEQSKNAPSDRVRRSVLRNLSFAIPAAAGALSGCASSGAPWGQRQPAATTMDIGKAPDLSATQAVAMIRSGDLLAEDYARALLARQERYKDLNAVTWINPAQVLERARAVDVARRDGKALPPLAGLPLIVKDNIDTLGFATSAGTPSLKGNMPKADAPVMARLYSQGALLLAKANMHELAIGGTSSNQHFGRVRNPYDTSRIPGGSSGGTAAAIAARIAPAGLGTDTAGSVRIPASFSGIAAFRPTTAGGRRGAYSVDGVVPLVLELDTIGPMARSVADVALLDAAIRGISVPRAMPLQGVRIGVPRNYQWDDIEPGVRSTLGDAMARLKEKGVVFVEVDVSAIAARSVEMYTTLYMARFGTDLGDYLQQHVPGLSLPALIEQIASRDVKARFDPSAIARPSADDLRRARQETLPKLLADYDALFRSQGIAALAFPTEPIVAPTILPAGDRGIETIMLNGKTVSRGLMLIRNTRATGALGVPGLSLAAGLTPQMLPVGLELDGLPGKDTELLSLGMGVEAALGAIPAPVLRG